MKYSNGISTREESYWYGFLIGDGNLAKGRNRVSIVLQERDVDHIHAAKDFFGQGNVRPVCDGYWGFFVENKVQTNNLRAIGFRPDKTKSVSWTDIPYEYTFDFLRGLFDADGTIYINIPTTILRWTGTESIVSGIRDVIDIRDIFRKLPSVVQDGESYSLGFNGRWKVEKLGKYLWKDNCIHLPRKRSIFQRLLLYNQTHPRSRSRLSDTDVIRIRELRSKKHKVIEIADVYGISPSMVSRICNGERYGYV